jgi:hypothetical protein
MLLMIQQYKDYKDKGDIYKIRAVNPHNGHEPSLSPDMHPCHQKASAAEEKDINDLTNIGKPLKLKYNYIHKAYKDSLLTATNIYNIRYCLRTKKLHGLTPVTV